MTIVLTSAANTHNSAALCSRGPLPLLPCMSLSLTVKYPPGRLGSVVLPGLAAVLVTGRCGLIVLSG